MIWSFGAFKKLTEVTTDRSRNLTAREQQQTLISELSTTYCSTTFP